MPSGRARKPRAADVSSPPGDDNRPADNGPTADDAAPDSDAAPEIDDSQDDDAREPTRKHGLPDVTALLATAVTGIGGAERPGQVTMAEAVQRAIETGEHLRSDLARRLHRARTTPAPRVAFADSPGSDSGRK